MRDTETEVEEVTFKIPRLTVAFLKSIAANTGQALDDMLGEALRRYARAQKWQMDEIRKAVEEAKRGDFVSHEEVMAEFRDILGEPTPERRRLLKAELGRQMSVISEDASCSLWAWRIEDELPPLLEEAAAYQRPVVYQGVAISPVYADWLVAMAEELGHWVTQGPGAEYVPFTPARRKRRTSPGAGPS